MWQIFGMALLWGGLGIVQVVWPFHLPGLQAPPEILLASMCLSLYLVPQWRLYVLAIVVFGLMELITNVSLRPCIPAALALLIPIQMQKKEILNIWPRAMLAVLLSSIWYEIILALLFIQYGILVFQVLWSYLLPLLVYQLIWGALLWLPFKWLSSVLHYQRFEYYSDARKGTLG